MKFRSYSLWRFILPLLFEFITQTEVVASNNNNNNNNNNIEPILPFGDINVVILTDVHSWIGGHGRHEPSNDADYGDVLSFYERLKAYCDSNDKDLWFVMNGDWIDGTGLAMDGDPSYLIPLLQKMPWDVVNTGNHELYRASVIDYIRRSGGFLDWWGPRHLASNIVMTETQENLSNKYIVLQGRHSTVLVFGFLYDLTDPADIITVEVGKDSVEQPWFQSALRDETYDAIMVMAHMGTDDPSVTIIRDAIRKYTNNNNMPIQFVAGHTHLRRYGVVDDWSTSFEAGRYLDTVGFVSFPKAGSTSESNNAGVNSTALFQHVFIDASKENLRRTLGANELETPNGKELSSFIQTTQHKVGLDRKLGCPPQDYYLNRTMYDSDSLWRLYKNQVAPTQLKKAVTTTTTAESVTGKRAIILDQGSWRYDLLGMPDVRYDDVAAVSPFDEPVNYLGELPGSIILLMNETLNANSTPFFTKLPHYILAGTVDDDDSPVALYSHNFELPSILEALDKVYPGYKPDIITTNMTSTNIWVSFALEQWPCPGEEEGRIPPVDKKNDGGDDYTDDSGQQDAITPVVTAFFAILFVCGGLCILAETIRQFCYGHTLVGVEEFVPVKEESGAYEDEEGAGADNDDEYLNGFRDEAEFAEFT